MCGVSNIAPAQSRLSRSNNSGQVVGKVEQLSVGHAELRDRLYPLLRSVDFFNEPPLICLFLWGFPNEGIMRSEKIDFVQIDYSAEDRAAEERILPLAAERGIGVVINQPFGGGSLLGRLHDRPLPGWAKEIGCTSWAQALLKFVLANPAVTCVIPGTGRPEYMIDNVHAGIGEYPDEALRKQIVAAISA